jgi:hypothetical protein
MGLQKFILTVEYYRNDDESVEIAGTNVNIVDGIVLFTSEVDTSTEGYFDTLKSVMIKLLNKFLDAPEFIQKTYPKFYSVSVTKPYWFHLFQENLMGNMKKSLEGPTIDEDEPSLEDNLDNSDEAVLDVVEAFYDKELNELYCQPDPINFWDTL